MRTLSLIAGSLAVVLTTLMIQRHSRLPAIEKDGRRYLTYTLPYQIVVLVLVALALILVNFCIRGNPGEASAVLTVGAASVGIAEVNVYRTFLISLAYDADYLYYSSPLAGRHRIAWGEVREIYYSPWMACHCIRTDSVDRIWCAKSLRGYWEFGAFLGKKHDQLSGAMPLPHCPKTDKVPESALGRQSDDGEETKPESAREQ